MTQKSTSFSPRLYPRPAYPSTSWWLGMVIERVTLVPLSTVILLLWVFWPVYLKGVYLYQEVAGLENERVFFTLVVLVNRIVTQTFLHGAFFLFEYYLYFEGSRMNRKPFQVPSMKLVKKTLMLQFTATVVIQPILIYSLLYPIMKFFGAPRYDAPLYGMEKDVEYSMFSIPLETWTHCYLILLFSHTASDFLFYLTHRALHHPVLYAKIHKQHHEYIGAVSPSAEYAHPVEGFVGNLFPVLFGPVLMAFHPAILVAWLSHKLKRVYEGHSGYAFKDTIFEKLGWVDAESSAYHDFHHTTNQGNFASSYIDWIFGTMDHWVAQGSLDGYTKKIEGLNASYLHQEKMARSQ